jgi:hypothetical protein
MSSSKSVTFNLNISNENNFSHSRKSSLNENLLKSESSNTRNSSDFTNIKTSLNKSNISRPSFISLRQKSEKDIFHGPRSDIYGNKIIKGSKNHKISFIDQISREKIAQIVLIDSDYLNYKKYNQINEECQCSACFIF